MANPAEGAPGGEPGRRQGGATWTEDRIAELRKLWAEGVSAGGIARTLGEDVSRSAVLGKLQRLGLLKSRKPAAAPRHFGDQPDDGTEKLAAAFRLQRPRHPRSEPPPAPWKAEAFEPLAGTTPRPWLTRCEWECAFPVDGVRGEAGSETLACCAIRRPGSAYCARHHAVVFRPAPPLSPALEWAVTRDASEQRAA
jgi:GcrA cell cycle regulator